MSTLLHPHHGPKTQFPTKPNQCTGSGEENAQKDDEASHGIRQQETTKNYWSRIRRTLEPTWRGSH